MAAKQITVWLKAAFATNGHWRKVCLFQFFIYWIFMRSLLSALFTTMFLWQSAAAIAAPKKCTIPGEVEQWAKDFCMYSASTDDLAHPYVVACMSKQPEVRESKACSSKKKYKTGICAVVVRDQSYPGNLNQCVKDKSFSGPAVRNGASNHQTVDKDSYY